MNDKSVLVYDIGSMNKDQISGALDMLKKKLWDIVQDDLMKESERIERLALIEMGANYLTLRDAADELCEAAKSPRKGRKHRIDKAVRAYEAHRRLEVRVPNPLNPGVEQP